jgi:hypothetical protein
MKIWCVDHAGLGFNVYSDLLFTKEEAQDRYDSLYAGPGSYRKMYQVEDIWGWCGRHFNEVIVEILASRDTGDGSIHIFGLRDEIVEAAVHCGLKQCDVDCFWINRYEFVLSVAWVSEGELKHQTRYFRADDRAYKYPTVVERRSKWEATSNVE